MTTDPHSEKPVSSSQPPSERSLRSRAMDRYQHDAGTPGAFDSTSQDDAQKTIHELRVHQIELQMQNDELRLSQIALEESQARFRDLYDNAPVGYCLVTADGQIDDANQTLGEMLGYTHFQLNSRKFTSLIDKDDQDVFYHLRRRILTTLRPQTCEVRMHRSDASCAWMELSVTIASVDGETVCLRVSLTNIDARVRAERAKALLENQLRESQKMEAIGTLAGGIAHDFNNILTAILANAEMTELMARAEAPKVLPFIQEIQKAADRACELVNQILAFCRRQPINRHVVSLTEIIEESIRLLRATMPARFKLEFTHDETVPSVLADDTQIEQIVVNFATNAMQAMEGKAGHLRIHLDSIKLQKETINALNLNADLWSACDSAVRIVFEDDGPGIEPSVVSRIFEPFFTTKPVNQGTGLGLAVVHGIVQAHDGQIVVDSKLGQGTVFTLYLPPARPVSEEFQDAQKFSPKVNSKEPDLVDSGLPAQVNRTVLYIDDDGIVLNAIVHLLGQFGISVHGYSDLTAALQYIEDSSNHVELLVTDYNMPGVSGLEFAKQVHEVRPALPIVVTSGYIDDELSSHAEEAGIVALLPKPFSAKDFLDLLKKLVRDFPSKESAS